MLDFMCTRMRKAHFSGYVLKLKTFLFLPRHRDIDNSEVGHDSLDFKVSQRLGLLFYLATYLTFFCSPRKIHSKRQCAGF